MSDDKQLPPGTPNSIQINLPGEWGSQKQEEIKVDSNRYGVASDRRYHWSEDLNFPARLPDILLQAGVWVGGSALLGSCLRSIPVMVEVVAPLAVLCLVAIAAGLVAFQRYSDLRVFLAYRCSLVICGVCLGVFL